MIRRPLKIVLFCMIVLVLFLNRDRLFSLFENSEMTSNPVPWRGVSTKATKERITNTFIIYKDRHDEEEEDNNQLFNKTQNNGYPRIVLLWSNWRSGTTFLGDVLATAVQDTFYSFEPLYPYGELIFRDRNNATLEAFIYLRDLLQCNLTNYEWQTRVLAGFSKYMEKNALLLHTCSKWVKQCGHPNMFSHACKSANLHLAKVVRLGLTWAKRLMRDRAFDLQIIFMVRDPRPVLQSRLEGGIWCSRHDCSNAEEMCRHLTLDLHDAKQMLRVYPERFKFIQYEQLCMHMEATVQDLWKFMQVELRQEALNKIYALTHGEGPSGYFEPYRNTKNHTFAWRRETPFAVVKEVQDVCPQVLKDLGYRSFDNLNDLQNMSIPSFSNSKPFG